MGLLGGSFDPPHGGHTHITRAALSRFALDRVWWLVSPGNPLKRRAPAAMDRRLAAARALVRHPLVEVTDLEARIGTRFTAETLRALRRRYRGVRFVWLMGADNLVGFHHWDEWDAIFRMVPVGVLARPGAGVAALHAPAARRFGRFRLPAARAHLLARSQPPVWCYLPLRHAAESSTAIRSRGGWPSG